MTVEEYYKNIIEAAAEMAAQKTAREVIAELQRTGQLRPELLGTFKKTERVLYMFPTMQDGDGETGRLYRQIRAALGVIADDPYFDLIKLKYFSGWTHERIAEYFDVDEKTIRYQRKKLIERLRPLIFSDEYLREIIFDM